MAYDSGCIRSYAAQYNLGLILRVVIGFRDCVAALDIAAMATLYLASSC